MSALLNLFDLAIQLCVVVRQKINLMGVMAKMSYLLFLSCSLHSLCLFLVSCLSFSCHRHTSSTVNPLNINLPMGAVGD